MPHEFRLRRIGGEFKQFPPQGQPPGLAPPLLEDRRGSGMHRIAACHVQRHPLERAGEVKFSGMVLPEAKLVTYRIEFKRVILRKLIMGIADGIMQVDGKTIYEAKDLRVGLFQEGATPA